MRNIQGFIVVIALICFQLLVWDVFSWQRPTMLTYISSRISAIVGKNNSTDASKISRFGISTAQIENQNIVHPSLCASPGAGNFSSQWSPTPKIQSVASSAETTRPSDGKNGSKVLCLSLHERLGNQMFEYASLLGIALKTKRIPVFLDKGLIGKVLSNTTFFENSFMYENRCRENFLHEPSCCKFFPGFFQLDPNKDYTIARNLQSWVYFIEHEAEIRQAMKFKDSILSQAQRTVTALRRKYNGTLTGIHIRRGDYLGQEGYGRKMPPFGYVLRAMEYVRKRYNDVTFVVCSEDVDWCNKQFANYSDVAVLKDHPSEAVDMMVLASLDHMIMTVGTYGWWASFLNPGITVYYQDFYYPNTYFASRFTPNGTDHYCPNWIPLL